MYIYRPYTLCKSLIINDLNHIIECHTPYIYTPIKWSHVCENQKISKMQWSFDNPADIKLEISD